MLSPVSMSNPASRLLWLMQLASPALPVGGFSYSEGLEAAVEHGMVSDETSAQAWLIDQLHLVQARSELPVLAQAMNAWRTLDKAGLQQLNDWVLQTRETFEMRLQTEQMGRSLLIWLRNHQSSDEAAMQWCEQLPPSWPLVFALALHRTRSAGVCICLGRKHGASSHQVRAIGSTQRPTHIGGFKHRNTPGCRACLVCA